MKHTPGPWFFDEKYSDFSVLANRPNANTTGEKFVATTSNAFSNWTKEHDAQKRADIVLISTAPEMLEALERYVMLYAEMLKTNDPDEKRKIIDANISHHREVRALIKKAVGE